MSETNTNKAIFLIESSLINLAQQGDTPVFSRATPLNLERQVEGSLQLYPVESFHPAFSAEDGSFLLEPSSANMITWNMDLSKSVWVKGSNVSVRTDYAGQGEYAPDGTQTSDRLRFDTGIGESQKLIRSFALEAGQFYTMTIILRLRGGGFGGNDVIRFVGDVANLSTAKIGLASLNQSVNRYQKLQLTFQAGGKTPIAPGNVHQIQQYSLAALTQNTATVVIPPGFAVAQNDWVGGQLSINGLDYLISANTGLSGGAIVVTVRSNTLVSDGLLISMKAQLKSAPIQNVNFEFYCESTASLDWGGMKLEAREFATSMNYQDEKIEIQAGSILYWRSSPIGALKTFGFFGEVLEWRGDGNLFDFSNLSGAIVGGKLQVTVDGNLITLSDDLPSSFKFFIQVLESNSSLSVYVNSVLKARTTTNNFTGASNVPLILTSTGVRIWQRLIIYDQSLLEGQVGLGEAAKQEVSALFANRVPIDAVTISAHSPLINLPTVTIPAKADAIAIAKIVDVDLINQFVVVDNSTGVFLVNLGVTIQRGSYIVGKPQVVAIQGAQIYLSALTGALIGDLLIYGESTIPGYAAVRFPFDPIDPQIIREVNPNLKRLRVDSALSFIKARALVRTELYQDVAEVQVRDLDFVSNYLFVDSTENLSVGCVIAQPRLYSELLIDKENYFAALVDPIPGVQIASVKGKWLNGLKIENNNNYPVEVTPYIRPNL